MNFIEALLKANLVVLVLDALSHVAEHLDALDSSALLVVIAPPSPYAPKTLVG